MLRVVHLINSLNMGGAEMQLSLLAKGVRRWRSDSIDTRIVTLIPDGVLEDIPRGAGVPVESLGMARGAADPRAVPRLVSILRRERPHILQTWLYHADLLGLIGARLARAPKLVWYLQCSNMDMRQYGRLTRLVLNANVRLSGRPDMVLANSAAGLEHHLKLGYRPRRSGVVPNGIDTELNRPDPEAAAWLRRECGIPERSLLVGLAGRFDPMKNQPGFLRAARLARQSLPEAHFALCGEGSDPENPVLAGLIHELGLEGFVHPLGRRRDLPRVLAGLDVYCLASLFGEGLPNVVAEAMACGAPCVVTEVGDAGILVGDTGRRVPPGDDAALAAALVELLRLPEEDRRALGLAAREHVVRELGLERLVERFAGLYAELGA